MLSVRYATRFRRDFKVCVKRGYDMEFLRSSSEKARRVFLPRVSLKSGGTAE